MADCPAARKAQYYLRFVNGMPDDYIDYLRLSLSPDCNSVEEARDVCIQYQLCQRNRSKKIPEVGASAQK